jgi:succinate-semialdehyde dehydrogenase/glutarate-semialdehyde dehydrogenase
MQSLQVGDPLDPKTDVGPLANEAQVKTLVGQVERSVSDGARLLTGGHRLDRPGYYFAPGVLTDISPEAPAHREEVFGPVALLFRARDVDQAIAIANDSPFGLGASAWTNNETERRRFITELESGMVFINAMVASDPRLPFGGVKQSGYGRELSEHGLREFVNIKTVWIGDA